MKLIKQLKNNIFILVISIIYYFTLSGMNIGDTYFRSLENGYPLFFNNIFGKFPLWFGFQRSHFLNIPTLRAIQLSIAKIGLFPNPLLLIQLVNLCLALFTLKLLYSLLTRLNINRVISIATTILFGFSYAFYANMNGEIHHFSIFLLAAIIWLLIDIERNEIPHRLSIFMFSFCLVILPLYHSECTLYSGLIGIYILFKKDLKLKFKNELYAIIFGAIILLSLLIVSSFIFHYLDNYAELGRPVFANYIFHLLPSYMRAKSEQSFVLQIVKLSNFNPFNFYIMFRSQLESFSIISRVAKILEHYKDITFYSNRLVVNISIITVVLFIGVFVFINILATISAIKKWRSTPPFIKFLIIMLTVYLISFGIMISSDNLLSEFFITSAMIHCVLLGYFINRNIQWQKMLYCILVVLTIFSNVFLYFYPQKISSLSINKIFDEIESKNKGSTEFIIFRVGLLNLPYEIGQRNRFRVYFDEHAYESRDNIIKYINSISKEFNCGKKIYLISPGFLFGDFREVNINSAIPTITENKIWINNLEYFLDIIKHRYNLNIKKKYFYNFGTLGQLGKIAVIELE